MLQLHDSYDKLLFVCQGYIDRLSIEKLPPALQQQLKELRASPVPLYDGRLPWSEDLQSKCSFHLWSVHLEQAHVCSAKEEETGQARTK